MFSYKVTSFLAWMGLFVVPATTANYEYKPIDFSCAPYNMSVSSDSLVQMRSAIHLKTQDFDEDFGGFSGILLSENQKMFYLITDRARFVQADIIWKNNHIFCLKNGTLRPIRGQSTRALMGHFADSEGLSFSDKNNHILVSFERDSRIVEYGLKDKKLNPLHTYRAFSNDILPYNLGYESVRLLKNGDMIAVPEYFPHEKTGAYPIYLVKKNQKKKQIFWFKPLDGHYITDVNILSNGDFVTLERYFSIFSGISIQIRHLKQHDLWQATSPHTPARARLIMKSNSDKGADNFEAIAVKTGKKGDYLYLISDNNFTSLQKTLIVSLFYPYDF